MDKRITDFVENNRVSVLTTLLPDGSPHSSTLHFASSKDLSYFIFWTERNSRKCGHFEEGKKYPSSLVVGFNENEFIAFQAEGIVELVENRDVDEVYKVYQAKLGGSEKYAGEDNDVLLKFVPKWWRYTEFKPKKFVLESK